MKEKSATRLQAMVCSNEQCTTWYRIGHHFFLQCPNCNLPMVQKEKEIVTA